MNGRCVVGFPLISIENRCLKGANEKIGMFKVFDVIPDLRAFSKVDLQGSVVQCG